MNRPTWLAVALILLAGAASAETLAFYNGNYVSANADCSGLSGGQVAWSMSTARSPSSGYTGPVFYGGVAGTESVAQWRIVNYSSPDYIQTQDSSAASGAFIHQVVMFTNATAQAWTGAVIQVGGYDFSGTTNWYRFVARDSGGSFYISGPAYIGAESSVTHSISALSWYNYNPSSSISTIGSSASWSPSSVTAVGLFQGSENTDSVNQGLGSKLFVFEAYGGAMSAVPATTVVIY